MGLSERESRALYYYVRETRPIEGYSFQECRRDKSM